MKVRTGIVFQSAFHFCQVPLGQITVIKMGFKRVSVMQLLRGTHEFSGELPVKNIVIEWVVYFFQEPGDQFDQGFNDSRPSGGFCICRPQIEIQTMG